MAEQLTEAQCVCNAILSDVKAWEKSQQRTDELKSRLKEAEQIERNAEQRLAAMIIPKNFKQSGSFTFRYGDGHIVATQQKDEEIYHRKVEWHTRPSTDQIKELLQ